MVKQPKIQISPDAVGQKVALEIREKRLESALRENLKRRKKQARAKTGKQMGSDSGGEPGAREGGADAAPPSNSTEPDAES